MQHVQWYGLIVGPIVLPLKLNVLQGEVNAHAEDWSLPTCFSDELENSKTRSKIINSRSCTSNWNLLCTGTKNYRDQ